MTKVSGIHSKRPSRGFVHQLLWYFLTPCLLYHQFLQLQGFQKAQKTTLYQQIKEISTWNFPFIDCVAQVQEQ